MGSLDLVFRLLSPGYAVACASCASAVNEAGSVPFLQGTALLSLMPLAVMGGAIFYIHRRVKQAQAAEVRALSIEAHRDVGLGREQV